MPPGRMLRWAGLLLFPALLMAQSESGDLLDRGVQLAREGRMEEARQELEAGAAAYPTDKRYPIELAGLTYREGDFVTAESYLRRALELDPEDAYANDFLASLYYRQQDYPSAVKFWNRIGEPRIRYIESNPPPPVPAFLYDRAFAVRPGEILTLAKYRTTMAWLENLDVLGDIRTEVTALPLEPAPENGNAPAQPAEPGYAMTVRWSPSTVLSRITRTATGLFTQRFQYRFENLNGKGMTLDPRFRWDAQKRRVFVTLSAPFRDQPSMRYRLYTDLRKETWNIGAPTDFRLNKQEFGGALRFQPNGRWWWEAGGRLDNRNYRGIDFASGFSMAMSLRGGVTLLDIPDHGFHVDLQVDNDFGRFYAGHQGGLFSRHQLRIEGVWRPRLRRDGDRQYEYRLRLGGGLALGAVPFDELFMLARQRDDGIPLRGHSGTTNGRKGRAPVGGQYVVMNFDFFRETWRGTFGAIDVGPLVDVGNMWRTATAVVQPGYSVDVGLQLRLRLSSGFTFAISYARDLRNRRGVLDYSMATVR